jgi:hypothetical protein
MDGLATPTQILLKRARNELTEHVPGGITIIGSGGKGLATFTPWVGFFDPDETITPERGVYVVYIFAGDLASITLTLNQGITELTKQVGSAEARVRLAADAAAIRKSLPREAVELWDISISLGTGGFRQRAYEAGNIVARRYDLKLLPPEVDLRRDLKDLLSTYQLAVAIKRELLQTSPGVISSSSSGTVSVLTDSLWDFKPKSDADYLTFIQGRQIRKSRRHEQLVREFGLWISERGWSPSTTEHPKDLVLRRRSSATAGATRCTGWRWRACRSSKGAWTTAPACSGT